MRPVRFALGLLLSAVLLWFLFRDTDWAVLTAALLGVDPLWLVAALALSVASFFVRVVRLAYVVRATHPARFRHLFSATQIGLLVNAVVPARLGDLVWGWVLARLERISFTRSLTLVGLDRVNDVIALVAVLLVSLVAFPLDTDVTFAAGAFGNAAPFTVSSAVLRPAAGTLGAALVGVVVVLVILYFRQEAVLRFIRRGEETAPEAWAERVAGLFRSFADGLHVFRSGRKMALAVLMSLATWALVALSLEAVLRAFHLDTPWYAPVLMLALLGVLTSVTVTPGLVGQYHVPGVAGLLMAVPTLVVEETKAVAIVAHVVALLPPVVLGVYCMMSEDLRIADLLPGGRGEAKPPPGAPPPPPPSTPGTTREATREGPTPWRP